MKNGRADPDEGDRRAIAEVVGNFVLTLAPLAPAQAQQLAAVFKEVRYRSRRPDDAAARARLRELASVRRRFDGCTSCSSARALS